MMGARHNARVRAVLAVLIVVPALVYLPGLRAPFVFDDFPNVRDNPAVASASLRPGDLWRAATESPLRSRPLAYVTFALNAAAGGLVGFHLVNLIVHLATTLAVFWLFRSCLAGPDAAEPDDERNLLVAAALPAALWSVAPVNVQAVTYTVQRMTSLATLGMVTGVACALAGWRDERRRLRWRAAAIAAIAVAAATKEIAILAPWLILLCRWTVHDAGRFRETLRWRGGWISAVAITVGLGLLYAWARSGDRPLAVLERHYSYENVPLAARLLTFPRIALHYASLVLWPVGRLNIDPEFELSRGLLTPWTTAPAGIVLLGGIGVLCVHARRWPIVALGVAWFLVCLVPEHTLLQLDLLFEHHAYLASVGFFLAAAPLVRGALRRGQAWRLGLAAAGCAAVLGASAVTLARNAVWRDPVALWRGSVERSQTKWRPPLNLARTLVRAGRLAEAEAAYRETIGRAPELLPAADELGQLLFQEGRMEEAERVYLEATSTVREPGVPWLMVASIREAKGDVPGALVALERAAAIVPREARVPFLMARALEVQGDVAGAAAAYERAVVLEPGFIEAWRELARVYEQLGRSSDAARARAAADGDAPPRPRSPE